MDNGKAKGAWSKLGIFYLRLKEEKEPKNQMLVIGIDPGSKFEGFTVLGTTDTVVNLEAEAPDWVKKSVETRRNMRRARRLRNCRRRECRFDNRLSGKVWLPPSTKSRWDAKLRIVTKLKETLPLTGAVVEDIKAKSKKGQRRWNASFSPMEAGKRYLYSGLEALGLVVSLKNGMETKEARDKLGLKKTGSKSKRVFEAHCVDSWVLAASMTGAKMPTTKDIYYLTPLRLHRRQLHRFEPSKGGTRNRYGGTMSIGIKKGTIVQDEKRGLCYVGGCMKGGISLHSLKTGERMTKCGKPDDVSVLTRISFRPQFLPALKSEIPLGF